jgi:type VI secretion system protein ImpK
MSEDYRPAVGQRGAIHEERRAAYRAENLALLYQGVFTGIVRVQAGRQPIVDPNAFQRRMDDLLLEVEREATKAGYEKEDIEEANYAVVAFLDETVLTSNDPAKDRWSSWQAKRYTGAIAGEGFFEHLKALQNRRDSVQLADLLEVYYLCLVLGYEGRYAIAYRSELRSLLDDLRLQIERIRGARGVLSPDSVIPAGEPVLLPNVDPVLRSLQLLAVLFVAVAVLSWGILKLLLISGANDVRQALNLLIAP